MISRLALSRRWIVLVAVMIAALFGTTSAVIAQSPDSSVSSSRGARGSGFSAQDPLNTLAQWSLGYDSRNSALMRDAFTTDAEFIYRSPAFEEPLVFNGIDEVMGLFEDALAGQSDQRRHAISTHLVERVNKRTVQITSYLTLLVINSPTTMPVVQSTGVYRDTLVLERDGKWRIKVRDLTLDTATA
jgi:SnoaL-like domain